jgi:hypothetical protein
MSHGRRVVVIDPAKWRGKDELRARGRIPLFVNADLLGVHRILES